MVNHAHLSASNFNILPGGYLGVDIFFVISGYLITSIIYKELINTGNFSFKYFYERRIRRIISPLIFVIVIIIPFAWYFLLPFSILDLSKSKLALYWKSLNLTKELVRGSPRIF